MASIKSFIFFLIIFIIAFYLMIKAKDQIPEDTGLLHKSAIAFFISIIGMVMSYLGLG